MSEETEAAIEEAAARYRNWGRWGPDDERGTLNFVTPETAVGLPIEPYAIQ